MNRPNGTSLHVCLNGEARRQFFQQYNVCLPTHKGWGICARPLLALTQACLKHTRHQKTRDNRASEVASGRVALQRFNLTLEHVVHVPSHYISYSSDSKINLETKNELSFSHDVIRHTCTTRALNFGTPLTQKGSICVDMRLTTALNLALNWRLALNVRSTAIMSLIINI